MTSILFHQGLIVFHETLVSLWFQPREQRAMKYETIVVDPVVDLSSSVKSH